MTVDEIHESLLTYVPDNYDKAAGSFFYDLLRPVAVRLYVLTNKIDTLPDETFALTAEGEYLDRKTAEQGLERRAAEYAKGTVTITGRAGEVVRTGSKVAADNVLYSVDETVSIPESGTVDVGATCVTGGAAGNVKAGTINRFPVTLPGIYSVINNEPFEGGYDAESDDELRERYFEKVSRPNASGNVNDYIAWAKEIAGVGDVQVIPLWNGPGTVKVVITDSNIQPADEELIADVTAHIEENRPIGASVTVASAESLTINISAKLTKESELDVQDEVENALTEYLSEYALEKEYVSYARIGSIILDIPGVEDYAELKVNNGTENVEIPDGSVPVLGSVVLT